MKAYVYVFALILLFSTVSYGTLVNIHTEANASALAYTDVTVSQAKAMIDTNVFSVLLDVRNQSEYENNPGHIKNAKLIPVWQLSSRLNELNPTDQILVYCRGGGRSATASQMLANNNFTHVYNMLGGIMTWTSTGYPVYIKYPSIQQAIDNAAQNSTLLISRGTYTEQIVVNKPLRLVGENTSTTTIDANASESQPSTVAVGASNVQMTGFTIRGSNGSSSVGSVAVHIAGAYVNITISDNEMSSDFSGIEIHYSANNTVVRNDIENTSVCILLDSSSDNNLFRNDVAASNCGLRVVNSTDNTVNENNITSNGSGIDLESSSNNHLYQNNFLDNTVQIVSDPVSVNTWDNGYPPGGNYWSDHSGADQYSGAYQNETGSDGIRDTPIAIDAHNTDNYPLMKPYTGPVDVGVADFSVSQSMVKQGLDLNASCKIISYGIEPASFNASFDANGTMIASFTNILLEYRTSTVLNYVWNTSGVDVGNYAITVQVSTLEGENDKSDNTRSIWVIVVSNLPGDTNGDGKVDMKDVSFVARRFMCVPGDPLWDPVADLNRDGRVDMKDVSIVAKDFGEHY